MFVVGFEVPIGHVITATATSPFNDTSEFSLCRPVTAGTAPGGGGPDVPMIASRRSGAVEATNPSKDSSKVRAVTVPPSSPRQPRRMETVELTEKRGANTTASDADVYLEMPSIRENTRLKAMKIAGTTPFLDALFADFSWNGGLS
jgi:hypothetical protein